MGDCKMAEFDPVTRERELRQEPDALEHEAGLLYWEERILTGILEGCTLGLTSTEGMTLSEIEKSVESEVRRLRMEVRAKRYEQIVIGAAVVSALAAVVSVYFSVYRHEDNQQFQIELETPRLDVNTNTLEPVFSRPGPTCITVNNAGKRHLAVHRIDFVPTERFETPEEEPACGAMETLEVVFHASDYQEQEKQFSIIFPKPIDVPGGENLFIILAIEEEAWVGFTYIGDVHIHYDRGKETHIHSVTIDVVATLPAPPPEAPPPPRGRFGRKRG